MAYKWLDVTLNTGRYILYEYRQVYVQEAAYDARPCGFALDEEGTPIWYCGVYGDTVPTPTYGDFVVHSEDVRKVLLAVPRYDYGSRTLHLSALYSYADSQGPVHILFDDECTRIDRFFTPCGRKGYTEMLWHRFPFYDGELLYCFYWYEGTGYPMMHLVKLSPDLEVIYRAEVQPRGPSGRILNAWVCRRASTHDYVGLIWTTGIGIPTQVHAIRRTSVEPYVAFDLMYDIDAMGGYRDGGVAAYVDDNCFAGLLLVNVNYVWNVYTFKWEPGQSFPPPLTLKTTFSGYPLFAAMVSPDDYVIAYHYYNASEDRDELHIVGADSYVVYGQPYFTDDVPPGRTSPSHFLATPSGVMAAPAGALASNIRYVLFYIPFDQYWRHMNREREVRVKRRAGGFRFSDGSIVYLDVGLKIPLGYYTDSEGVHVVLYNYETGKLEDHLHPASGERVLKSETDASFTPYPPVNLYIPLIVDDDSSYFITYVNGEDRLVKLHLPSKQLTVSGARVYMRCVGVKKVGGEIHVASFGGIQDLVVRQTVDAATMEVLYECSLPFDPGAYGRPLAVAPVKASRGGVTCVALVAAVNPQSGKITVYLVGEDGSIVAADAEDPGQIPVFPGQWGVDMDAWWDGSRVYAVVAATPVVQGYDAKLLWVKLDGQGFRYGVLRTLSPSGYTHIDRRPMYASIVRVRVDGWESWRLVLEPDDGYIYPPKQWLLEGFHPLFSIAPLPVILALQEEVVRVTPLQVDQDCGIIFSYAGIDNFERGYAAIPSSTLVGNFFYILKAPSPPPPTPPPALPPARRLLTLFRGRVGKT